MRQIAEDIIDGSCCELCCCYFVDKKENLYSHGYPVVCDDCWKDLTKDEKKLHQRQQMNIHTL